METKRFPSVKAWSILLASAAIPAALPLIAAACATPSVWSDYALPAAICLALLGCLVALVLLHRRTRIAVTDHGFVKSNGLGQRVAVEWSKTPWAIARASGIVFFPKGAIRANRIVRIGWDELRHSGCEGEMVRALQERYPTFREPERKGFRASLHETAHEIRSNPRILVLRLLPLPIFLAIGMGPWLLSRVSDSVQWTVIAVAVAYLILERTVLLPRHRGLVRWIVRWAMPRETRNLLAELDRKRDKTNP